MSYDWQEVFKNKTSKELYKIYLGDTLLPSETKEFARNELERRNFNFDNIEAHKTAWKLSNLIEEDNYLNSEMSGQGRVLFVSFKLYLFFLLLFFLFMYFMTGFQQKDTFEQLMTGLIASGVIGVLVLINNYFYKRIQVQKEKRKNRIKEIENSLKEQNLLEKDSPIMKDLRKDREIESSGTRTMMVIYAICLFLIIASFIYKIFFK